MRKIYEIQKKPSDYMHFHLPIQLHFTLILLQLDLNEKTSHSSKSMMAL